VILHIECIFVKLFDSFHNLLKAFGLQRKSRPQASSVPRFGCLVRGVPVEEYGPTRLAWAHSDCWLPANIRWNKVAGVATMVQCLGGEGLYVDVSPKIISSVKHFLSLPHPITIRGAE
jgi:hypothetical protein